jgi:hypothetical protein
VSTVSTVVSQPDVDVIAVSGSVTVNEIVASVTYQPLFPRVPLACGVMTGGVESANALAVATQIANRTKALRRAARMRILLVKGHLGLG